MGAGMDHSQVIESIYDAAFQPERWPRVVDDVCQLVGASTGWLISPYTEKHGGVLWTPSSLSADAFADYEAYYYRQDPWTMARGSVRGYSDSAGGVCLLDEHFDRAALRRTEIYTDICKPIDVEWLCGVNLCGDTRTWMPRMHLSLVRPKHAAPFDKQEVRQLQHVAPHLVRSVELNWRIRQANAARGVSLALLDRLPVGVALLDAGGRVMHRNAAAERLLSGEGWGVTIRERRLAGATLDQTAALERLCGQAVATSAGLGNSAGGAIRLGDPTQGRMLDVLVSPLPGQHPLADGTRRAAALVFLSDPKAERTLSHDILRQLFGLTAAEAGVAEGIANGMTPDELADARGTDRDTVRGQLQIAFQKTGTRRQAELAKAVLSSAAGLPGPTGLRSAAGVDAGQP